MPDSQIVNFSMWSALSYATGGYIGGNPEEEEKLKAEQEAQAQVLAEENFQQLKRIVEEYAQSQPGSVSSFSLCLIVRHGADRRCGRSSFLSGAQGGRAGRTRDAQR